MNGKWIVKREKLLEVMDILSLIPVRQSSLASVFIKCSVKKNTLHMQLTSEASGFVEVKGTGTWPFEKEIYLDRRLLVSFIIAAKYIKSKSDFVFSKVGKTEMMLKNGTRRMKIACSHTIAGYTGQDSRGKEIKAEPHLFKMLVAAEHCTEGDSSVPEMDCVFVKNKNDGVLLYGTTGAVIFKALVKSKLKLSQPLPFPLYIIRLLTAPDITGIELTPHEIVIDFGFGKIWQGYSAKAAKKFPHDTLDFYLKLIRQGGYKKVKKKGKVVKVHVEPAKLAFETDSEHFSGLLQRLSGYLSSVRRLDWVLTLKGTKGESKMDLVVTIGSTTFREQMHLEAPAKYDFSVDWALSKVIDVISTLSQKGKKMFVYFDKERQALLTMKNVEIFITRRVK